VEKMNIDAGGANPSYQGYDYQKLVTVWVALRLMFGPGASTEEIIVEPASHDDVKARLDVSAESADASLKISVAGELHVQIKFKGAGYWSAKDFAAVVDDKAASGKRGPKPRARAKALLLADANRRYVFITNNSVDDPLSKGRVNSPQDPANPAFFPTNLNVTSAEKKSLAGRFALIEAMTFQETRRQIESVLTAELHVPTQGLDAVIERLKLMVEDRFLEVPDPLRKRDIEKVAEAFGGIPHPNPQLAIYMPPATLADAEARLSTLGAVLLIGPSGYGKSLTADKLSYDRRHANPPYKVVREKAGLDAIEDAFAAPGRVLFHLEDPWGQSGLKKNEAEEWSQRIGALIQQRASDKLFVITSRSEIYREALGSVPIPVWSDRAVVIDDLAYDHEARKAILRRGLANASSWRQDLERQHEYRLLQDLRSPLELIAFDRELKALSKLDDFSIDRLVDRALTNSRSHVVRDQIRALGDRAIRGTAVLWAMLRDSQNLQPESLASLRRQIDRTSSHDIALDDLALHLSQTQLSKDGDGAYTAHSKVVEAMRNLASEQPRATEIALNAAATAAVTLTEQNSEWLEVLQRLVLGARDLEKTGVVLDVTVEAALDRFLIDGLSKAVGHPRTFRRAWRAASRQLTKDSPIARLIDWVERGGPRDGVWNGFGWQPPKITDDMRNEVVAADPGLRILKGFIAHQLPHSPDDYDAEKLLRWLKPFGADFTKAFLEAGKDVVRSADYVMSADAISECALAGSQPPYDAVWAQIVEMDKAVNEALEVSREERRQAWQGELDFAAGLAVQERSEDEGPSAAHFAKGYVKARRRRDGYAWIKDHPRPDFILPVWADTMRYSLPKVSAEELSAFFSMAGGDDSLQADGLRVIADRRLTFARDRVIAALTSGGPRAVDAAVRALSFLEGDGDEKSGKLSALTILLGLLQTLPAARAALLASEIVDLEYGKKKGQLAQRVLAASPPNGSAAVHLALARALGADDATLLQRFRELPPGQAEELLTQGPRGLARLLLVISAAEGHEISSVAANWIASDSEDDARAGVHALAQIDSALARSTIMKALGHQDYNVRRSALQALAVKADQAERTKLMALKTDKSAPVREALAKAIGSNSWSDGVDVLTGLLNDRRNYARHPEYQRREEPEFHVARAAATALQQIGTLPSTVMDQIIEFLSRDDEAAIDVELHAMLLDLITYPDHQNVWSAIRQGLLDGHVVGDVDENLYPVRYAAAWAVVHRISRHPLELGMAPWDHIEAGAAHIDPQLAAPLLLALGGQMATECKASSLEVFRQEETTVPRVALALSMIDDFEAARALAIKHNLLSADHPFLTTDNDCSSDQTNLSRWPLSNAARQWLESLKGGSDVEDTLLWVLTQRTGVQMTEEDYQPWAFRRKVKTPVTTLSEMFGME
jgi:hypothetical protein